MKTYASLTRTTGPFELRPKAQSCQEVTAMAEGSHALEPAEGGGRTRDETLVGIGFHSLFLSRNPTNPYRVKQRSLDFLFDFPE